MSITTGSPSVYLTTPNFFTLWADALPNTVPPPIKERSIRAPFGINDTLFHFALQPAIPFSVAIIYVTSVYFLNAYNRRNHQKPWNISRSSLFHAFVVLHNVALAVYSAITFLAMSRALTRIWPGLDNEAGAAGIADALCKLHGPRGIGDATTFNTTINIWEAKNPLIHLAYDGTPDPTDVGRLWNEGLAFWGWIFYVSKFYEVIDTLIIVAKGKRSPTLQTFHHAGAMLCMWSGIRYMSPPIWMFVWINSGIHAMMYTYYTLSAISVPVPKTIKQSLTTMQITQFLIGASYAAAHLFVAYDIPVRTPYKVAIAVRAAASSASSAASAASSAVSEVIESPLAQATFGALMKKLLLRAAGEEGVAERVHGANDIPSINDISGAVQDIKDHVAERFETHWRTDWTRVHCLDTSGEAVAIYMNLLYLFPLTLLFGRFFFRAYLASGKRRMSTAARDAKAQTEAKVEQNGKATESKIQKEVDEDLRKIKEGTYEAKKSAKETANKKTQKTDANDKSYAEAVRKDLDELQAKETEDATLAQSADIRPGASAGESEKPIVD